MLKVNQVVKVIGAGKWSGLVGVVEEVKPDTGAAKVQIDGVKDNAPVSGCIWFKHSALEVV